MSLGNLNSSGDKKSNFNWQLRMLEQLGIINSSIVSITGDDHELRITSYRANVGGVGYSLGDFISRTDILFVPTGAIVSTLWFNETTGLTIGTPPQVDLDPYVPPGAVTVSNLPITLGQLLMSQSLSVTMASDQSDINVELPSSVLAPSVVSALVNGNTIGNVRAVSLWFRGNNGTLDGVGIPNGGVMNFSAGGENDLLSSMAYTVPTTGESRIIISYVN